MMLPGRMPAGNRQDVDVVGLQVGRKLAGCLLLSGGSRQEIGRREEGAREVCKIERLGRILGVEAGLPECWPGAGPTEGAEALDLLLQSAVSEFRWLIQQGEPSRGRPYSIAPRIPLGLLGTL